MATYRQNNVFGFLDETEGDPEVVATVKETPKKQEPAKTTVQPKAPLTKKQDPTPQKPADKNQGTQYKKPADNQPNKAAKPADKPAPRANNAPPNKAPTNNTKPQTAADSGADLELTEKPSSSQKQRTYEAVKKDRKSRNGYDNNVKKGGEGRYNWGGQGEEFRQRKPRRSDNSFEDSTKEGEENPAVPKEGEAAPAEGADAAKSDVPKEQEKKSYAEYLEEQKTKAKLDLKLPEARKAGEGEEGKWNNTIKLDKKNDDAYMQATVEAEPKKAATTAAQTNVTEKDTKNKKGQVLELNLPRLRKQPRENYKDGSNPREGSFKNSSFKDNNSRKGSFKKSDGATLTLDDFPRLSNTA